ncbi:hypothetical protein Tco_1464639, partial [Tanacetum coccineum]
IQHMHQTCVSDLDVVWKHMHQTPMVSLSFASVLIGGGVTSDDGLVDETSVKGAITGGVDVTV